MEADSKDFIVTIKVKLQERNPDMSLTWIRCQSHTPIMQARCLTRFHARASATDSKHDTPNATINASGKILSHFLILKGKPTGHIKTCEFTTYPDARKFAYQEKAGMYEPKIHKWINVVLKLWKDAQHANNPSAESPILVFDVYGSVVN